MSRKKKRGQSTLEYIIIFGAIIAAIVIFATGTLRNTIGNSLDHVATEMNDAVNLINY